VGPGRVELPTSPLSVGICDCITVCDNLLQPAIHAALPEVSACAGLGRIAAIFDCHPSQKPSQISLPYFGATALSPASSKGGCPARLLPANPGANAGHWRGFYSRAQPRRCPACRLRNYLPSPFCLPMNMNHATLVRPSGFNLITSVACVESGAYTVRIH
jgi:hypothetical protein